MALYGPVMVIEDDMQDAETITAAIIEIGVKNEIKTFFKAQDAYEYLLQTNDKPMFILCDIRMTNLDGLSFRKMIRGNSYLRQKAIPFIYLSGVVSDAILNEAYSLDIQGYFKKPETYQALKDHLQTIFIYWQRALHPIPVPSV